MVDKRFKFYRLVKFTYCNLTVLGANHDETATYMLDKDCLLRHLEYVLLSYNIIVYYGG